MKILTVLCQNVFVYVRPCQRARTSAQNDTHKSQYLIIKKNNGPQDCGLRFKMFGDYKMLVSIKLFEI